MANIITLSTLSRGAAADGSTNNAIQIKVTDSSTGAVVPNSTVTLTVSNGAYLSASSLTTGTDGTNIVYVISGIAGSYTVTASQTGATSAAISTSFTTLQETAAANRALDTMQNALGTSAGANYVGYNSAVTYDDGTLGAAFNAGGVNLTKLNNKAARYLDIEDYADDASASGDWTSAIQSAIDAATNGGILEVRGTGRYTISGTIQIRNTFGNGLNINIHQLTVTSAFPANTSFWDATPMITIGDSLGNTSGLNLYINVLDGGGKADGIQPIGYGFSLSDIHIGTATNCIAVIRMGNHQWPNASNAITGDYWNSNYVGIYLANGTAGSSPIVEGWKVFVKFIAANYWGGIWLFNCGQYAQLSGDWDYNGKRLAVLKLTDNTGLTSIVGQNGLKLTDGTNELEYLFYYTSLGNTYIVVASPNNISASDKVATFPWTAGAKISCTTVSGVAMVFSTINVAGDNTSQTNFFDILHDYERAPFGRIQVNAGYLSGIIGGLLYTSTLQYQNSFSSPSDSYTGFSITNTGSSLALYNSTVETIPFMGTTADFVNFNKKLFMKDYLYEGVGSANTFASSTSATSVLALLKDSINNKYLGEGTMYDITLKTNYNTCGSFRVYVIASGTSYSHVVVSSYVGDAIAVTFTDTTSGVQMNFRQEAQAYMQVVTNVVRV